MGIYFEGRTKLFPRNFQKSWTLKVISERWGHEIFHNFFRGRGEDHDVWSENMRGHENFSLVLKFNPATGVYSLCMTSPLRTKGRSGKFI